MADQCRAAAARWPRRARARSRDGCRIERGTSAAAAACDVPARRGNAEGCRREASAFIEEAAAGSECVALVARSPAAHLRERSARGGRRLVDRRGFCRSRQRTFAATRLEGQAGDIRIWIGWIGGRPCRRVSVTGCAHFHRYVHSVTLCSRRIDGAALGHFAVQNLTPLATGPR